MAHKTQTEQFDIRVGNRGRLVLPAKLRRRLRLREGDRMVLTVEGDGSLRLVSLREQIRRLCGIYAHVAPGRSLADELIRERREEARREEEKEIERAKLRPGRLRSSLLSAP